MIWIKMINYYAFCLLLISALGEAASFGDCQRDVDPCSSDIYIELDDPSRSIRFNVTEENEDDYTMPEKWYRSVSGAGGDMSTETVYTGQCNAYSPIWLNGSLPNAEDGIVDVPGCASFLYEECVREYTIPVKNCGDFNVYCLFPVIDSFDRFCMGSEVACPEGYTSENGFTPGCEIIDTTTTIITTTEESVIVAVGECPRDMDPCSSAVYTVLDDPTRSTRFNVTADNEHDYILSERWYRSMSGAGGEMPNQPVYTGQCNAYAPIWLTDTVLREENGIANMLACASFLQDDCVRRYSIPVKNCGGYSVYCLYPVADAFDRFCMGTEVECPEGYTSNSGFTPDCTLAITPTSSTTETPRSSDSGSNEVEGASKEGSSEELVTILAVVIPLALLIIAASAGVLLFMRFYNIKNTHDDEPYEKTKSITELSSKVDNPDDHTYDQVGKADITYDYTCDMSGSPEHTYDTIPDTKHSQLEGPVVCADTYTNNAYCKY